MVDLFLVSVDQLKDILRCYRANDELNWSGVHELTKKLELVTAGNNSGADASNASEEKTAYGFFNPVEPKAEEESFGFFESVDGSGAAQVAPVQD
jgi:two-component system chemotaxis sensor kinase CheA